MPGGKNGRALASTTRRFDTPYTRAWLSTTARGSFFWPILHVADAWDTVLKLSRITLRISASVDTLSPGKYSGPITTPCFITWVAHISRTRLYAATATTWSVGWVSQFGLIRGWSAVSVDEMETLPRDRGATKLAATVAYWYPSTGAPVR